MFCGKCGSQVENGVEFCPVCGNRLLDDRSKQNPPSQPYQPNTPNSANTVYQNNTVYITTSKSKLEHWCNFLLVFVKIVLVIEILASIGAGIYTMVDAYYVIEIVTGILIIVLGTLVSLLSNAFVMIFIYMAKDIAAIRASLSNNNMRQ